jgi:galactose mutarotase-like enzyme
MPTPLTLSHDGATMTILPQRGGLLRSLLLRAPTGEVVDVLWSAPDFDGSGSGWPMGGAPFLFPFAGRLFHEGQALKYELGGVERHMPLHGFAYGLPWDCRPEGQDTVVAHLKANDATRVLYPFEFAVTLRYALSPSHLRMTYRIQCLGSLLPDHGPMPVAPGWHPFFKMPLRPLSRLSECRLVTSARHKIRVTPQGMAGKSAPYPEDATENDGRLSDPLYRNIILGHHGKPEIALRDFDSKLAIRVSWDPSESAPYVVLWSREGEGFHCVEPWTALPDPLASGHGVLWLRPGQEMEASTQISIEQISSSL